VVLGLGFATWHFAFRTKKTTRRHYPQPAWAGTEYPSLTPVRVATAELVDLPVHLKAIGTVTPLNTVTVKSRVAGQLLRVMFEEGQQVKSGDLLAEIDPAPYRIRLAEAEGQLKQNAVQLETAQRDLVRLQDLHKQKLITDQDLEVQRAMVGQRAGALASVQAQVDNARLQLAYTRIESPITGRVGFRQVDPGNLVAENSANGLVVITQTRPIAVTFTIPEVALQSVLDPFRAGKTLAVEAWNRQETAVLATGVLKTVDNQIDTATGTLRLKAEFANDDDHLFPNQFVNVRMRVGTRDKSVVIPAASVQFGSRGTYVYIIDANKKAAVRDVVLGPTDGSRQAVSKGLEAGDVVVLEGIDRLREGRGVVVTNDPAATTAP